MLLHKVPNPVAMTNTTVLVENVPLNMNSDDVRRVFETVTLERVEKPVCISPKIFEVVVKSRTDADRVIEAFKTRTLNNEPIIMKIKTPTLVKGRMPNQGSGGGGGGGQP